MEIRMSIRRTCRQVSLLQLGVLLVPAVALCADDRPATLAAAGGNPLALNAWAFLGWYWKMLLLLAAIALVLRLFGGRLGMLGQRKNREKKPEKTGHPLSGKNRKKTGHPLCERKKTGHPLCESLLKAGAARAFSRFYRPYLGLSATPTRRNGGQSGPMGKMSGSYRKTTTGFPPMLYRVRLRGFRERAEGAQLGNSRRQARMPRAQR